MWVLGFSWKIKIFNCTRPLLLTYRPLIFNLGLCSPFSLTKIIPFVIWFISFKMSFWEESHRYHYTADIQGQIKVKDTYNVLCFFLYSQHLYFLESMIPLSILLMLFLDSKNIFLWSCFYQNLENKNDPKGPSSPHIKLQHFLWAVRCFGHRGTCEAGHQAAQVVILQTADSTTWCVIFNPEPGAVHPTPGGFPGFGCHSVLPGTLTIVGGSI